MSSSDSNTSAGTTTTNSPSAFLDKLGKDDRFAQWVAIIKQYVRSDAELVMVDWPFVCRLALGVTESSQLESAIEKMGIVAKGHYRVFVLYLKQYMDEHKPKPKPMEAAQRVFEAFFAQNKTCHTENNDDDDE